MNRTRVIMTHGDDHPFEPVEREAGFSRFAHDLNHLHQAVKTMAKPYTDDVGPWRAYPAILDVP